MFSIPNEVIYIINKLKDNNFLTYIVGGAVRDFVMGANPTDFDLATSAKPENIIDIFKDHKLVESGIKHGTVGIIVNNKIYELTTFRNDINYSDNRHPDVVEFINDLKSDVFRRDFTINALAYDINNGIIDFVNGKNDIANKIIRTVGNPDHRFNEDSLRILRALRFSSVLNFSIEDKAQISINNNYKSIDNISKERIFSEVSKILCGKNILNILLNYSYVFAYLFKPLNKSIGFNQFTKYHIYDVWEHTANVVSKIEPTLVLRFAALLHDSGKPYRFTINNSIGHFYGHANISKNIAKYVLEKYKAPNIITNNVIELVKYHHNLIETDKNIKKMISKIGITQVENLLKLQKADAESLAPPYNKEYSDNIDKLILKFNAISKAPDACFRIKDLKINGKDLIEIGVPEGKEIGFILNKCFNAVLSGNIENDKNEILKFIKNNNCNY